MINLFTRLGSGLMRHIYGAGGVGVLGGEALLSLFTRRPRWREIGRQIVLIGVHSQGVVLITGIFTGMVFAVQTYYQFNKVQMDTLVGAVVSIAMATELGPVLAALMVTGRVGAAMSAELGTMKVTEQVDALRSLGIHPIDYLVVPRLVALCFSLPILTLEAVVIGIYGAYALIVGLMHVDGGYYLWNMEQWTLVRDFALGLIKALVFAVLICLICCHKGLSTEGGAEGVGRSTNQAVVASSFALLIANFFITVLFSSLFQR
jgi:phospholipid/cholesterol/gamma-HCH transport system permease protein